MTLSKVAPRPAMPSPLAAFSLALASLASCTAAPSEPRRSSYIVFLTPLSAELDEAAQGVAPGSIALRPKH